MQQGEYGVGPGKGQSLQNRVLEAETMQQCFPLRPRDIELIVHSGVGPWLTVQYPGSLHRGKLKYSKHSEWVYGKPPWQQAPSPRRRDPKWQPSPPCTCGELHTLCGPEESALSL